MPCINEIPELQFAYKKFKEKYEDKDFELNSYRVNRTRLTDGEGGDRDALGHLHDRQQ